MPSAPSRVRARSISEGRSGIAGVPIAYKDLLCIRGVPTTAGSRVLEGFRPPYDADRRAALRGRGLVLLGKTNMDEFAMGSSTENSRLSARRATRGIATRVPGGSSGGSAAAVAAGMAPLVARHRHRRLDPPAGRALRRRRHEADLRRGLALRRWSPSPARSTRSARSRAPCADCALLLRRHRRAPTRATRPASGRRSRSSCPSAQDLRGLRVGAIALDGIGGVEPGVRASYEAALERVRALGGELVEASLRVLAHAARASRPTT